MPEKFILTLFDQGSEYSGDPNTGHLNNRLEHNFLLKLKITHLQCIFPFNSQMFLMTLKFNAKNVSCSMTRVATQGYV